MQCQMEICIDGPREYERCRKQAEYLLVLTASMLDIEKEEICCCTEHMKVQKREAEKWGDEVIVRSLTRENENDVS